MRLGTNSGVMKDRNIRMILNMVHQNSCCRAEIAKRSGLTRATVSILTDELIRLGLIAEIPDNDFSGVGRCPLKLSVCVDFAYVVGIALERRCYRIGLFDLAGRALEQSDFLYNGDDIAEMARTVEGYFAAYSRERIIGIGVAGPGPVDYREGKFLNPPNFDEWHGCNIVSQLTELTDIPVFLENISNALAVAHKYFGVCREEENYAYILIDDGIGSGIVVNGNIYRGKSGYGNELGHTSISYNGILCSCGNRGCLECYASIPAILKDSGFSSWREAVDSGDNLIIEREAEYISCAIVNLVNLFDLEKIIIGGDIVYKGEKIVSILEKTISERIITQRSLPVVPDTSIKYNSAAGAAVAIHKLLF